MSGTELSEGCDAFRELLRETTGNKSHLSPGRVFDVQRDNCFNFTRLNQVDFRIRLSPFRLTACLFSSYRDVPDRSLGTTPLGPFQESEKFPTSMPERVKWAIGPVRVVRAGGSNRCVTAVKVCAPLESPDTLQQHIECRSDFLPTPEALNEHQLKLSLE